jgi:hypothetical protein
MARLSWSYRVEFQRLPLAASRPDDDMESWESSRAYFERHLNERGLEGWDLVNVTYPVTILQSAWALLTFKRPSDRP